MALNRKPVDPADIIKIEAITLPETEESGDGEYELRFGTKPKEKFYHDLLSLNRWLTAEFGETKASDLLDRLQNFRVIFINLENNEITTNYG